ncbi:hypothetical protein FRC00_002586 [Tulasnella sp. 408]|nr:hypothetical protein FRC00_002586 [Tulasnella sp. 408]
MIVNLSMQVLDKSLGSSILIQTDDFGAHHHDATSQSKHPTTIFVISQSQHWIPRIIGIKEPIKVTFTHIIIISLSYPNIPGIRPLEGTKNDFGLLLDRFNRESEPTPA